MGFLILNDCIFVSIFLGNIKTFRLFDVDDESLLTLIWLPA